MRYSSLNRNLFFVIGILVLSASEGEAQMNLTELKGLPECEKEEVLQLEDLFHLNAPRKGGAGGSVIKWAEKLDSVIVYPGEDGKSDGSGGSGASPARNIRSKAVMKVSGTDQGLEIVTPGYRGFLPWSIVDDLERLKRVD